MTGDITIGELSDRNFDVEALADYLTEQIPKTRLDGVDGELSPSAANKEIRQLQAMLNFCGQKAPGNPRGQGLIPDVPILRKLPEPDPEPRFISDEELDAIYRACNVAKWPREEWTGFAPADWWRSSIVYLANCGSRTVDWLDLKTDDVDLDLGIVTIARERKTKKTNRLPLARCVVDHLREIWSNRDLVFPAPKNKKYRNATFRSIQEAAGIGEPYRLKDLRSTCGDRWFVVDPAAARGVLNHTHQSTTDRHYARAAQHEFDRLAQLADRLEQPSSFLRDTPQLRLVK